MSRILVAFDLYGTLLSTESIATELAGHFGEEKAKLIAVVWRKYQLEYTWRLNSMKQYQPFSEVTRKSLQHALAEHAVNLDERHIDGLMHAYDCLSAFPDVEPALQQLSANDRVDCVVFSNGTREMVSSSVNKSRDLSQHASVFKKLVTVDFIQSFKPMPEVYKYLARVMDMVGQEDQMWLVSGNPFDVTGARAIGMQAAWVDRLGTGWQDKLGAEPTVIVRSLEDIVAVVEEHARKTAR